MEVLPQNIRNLRGLRLRSRCSAHWGMQEAVCKKICWLIAHHHTYQEFESIVHQILPEADFLVNLFEDEASPEARPSQPHKKIFRTGTGK